MTESARFPPQQSQQITVDLPSWWIPNKMFHVSLTGLAPHENAAAAVTVVGERKSSSRGPESGLQAGVDASGNVIHPPLS